MRFRLRTLLILLALVPPVIAGAWLAFDPSSFLLIAAGLASILFAFACLFLVAFAIAWTAMMARTAILRLIRGR